MAKITDVNGVPTTGAAAIYKLKTTLKAAGWTVPRSSDGSTYNSSGDQITHAGIGAGGMENGKAWFVIESPNGEHQWCFQRDLSDNAEWRVKVSSLDGFTGGSPGILETPYATDEQIMNGGGSDGSPTFGDLFTVDGGYRFNVIAQDAATGTGVEIYGFWAFAVEVGIGDIETIIAHEPMDPDTFPELSSGTRAAPVIGDPDPCIYVCDFGGGIATKSITITTTSGYWAAANSSWKHWHRMNYGDEAWVVNQACAYKTAASAEILAPYGISTTGMASNPYNGADDCLPICTGRPALYATEVGRKGFCNFLKMRTINKNFPDTINITTDAMVYVGDLLIPWEDNTTPLV
jgi:hypothetical protein